VIAVTAPPAPVRRSFVLWIAAVVVGLVASGVSLVEGPAGPAPVGLAVGLAVLVLLGGSVMSSRSATARRCE
jgi:hypothetical protein